MKKLIKFLLPFVATISVLSGCKNKKEKESEKVAISFGDVNAKEVSRIDIKKFQNLSTNKDNFLFVVSSTTCVCWNEFKPVLEKYITNNKLVCYEIPYNEFSDYSAMYKMRVSSSTTTFAIFENGEIKYSLTSGENDKVMEDYKEFEKYMDSSIIKPSCFYIKENDLQTIKASDKNAVIYFERSECGDCNYINPTMLRNYVSSHKNMNKIYVLDCEQYYKKQDDPDYQSYVDKKIEFGLASSSNPDYGYKDGKFPFFSYIEKGEYKSGAVIFNDTLEEVSEGKYKISDTYYTTERISKLGYNAAPLENLLLDKEDVTEYGSWKHDSASEYYTPIFN